jgi:uncharacterized protein
MAFMFRLSRIAIYPIKSLDGHALNEAQVLPTGALANDRRYALRDTQGAWVNAKATPDIHLLRARFNADLDKVTLSSPRDGNREAFHLPADLSRLESYLTAFFGKRIMLVENHLAGFPDDTDSPGPTIVSRQTLGEVGRWFADIADDEVRARFRANIEIDGDAPFCEDRLVADDRHVVRFEIGDIAFEGVTPCQRCVVPTRHPETAEIYPQFARHFADRRRETLPSWTTPDRFDHFYRLSVNTRLSPLSTGGTIRVGDEVRILGVATA